jgi:predicted nucleic acid-binding protein
MPETAYFDSNLWIAYLTDESAKPEVEALIREIKESRGQIITSILTITEISVHAYQQAPEKVADGVDFVSSIGSIRNVSVDIALFTAQIEARFMNAVWADADGRRKRRWDALHLATAAVNRATVLYTYDERLLRADFSPEPRIPPIRRPQPLQGALDLQPR